MVFHNTKMNLNNSFEQLFCYFRFVFVDSTALLESQKIKLKCNCILCVYQIDAAGYISIKILSVQFENVYANGLRD